jgi:very-short-patch-repair endonuclease
MNKSVTTRAAKPNKYPTVLPMLRMLDLEAVAELKFSPVRKWRADFALPTFMILIEIDGGCWSGGRHTRGAGFISDQEKLNAAAILGYRVLRFVPNDIRTGVLLTTVRYATQWAK